VRVWWPPTTDKSRTGFSGAYWPATELKQSKDTFKVQYDNGDVEAVHVDNVFPFMAPIDFGKEAEPLQVRVECVCVCVCRRGCDAFVCQESRCPFSPGIMRSQQSRSHNLNPTNHRHTTNKRSASLSR
jgi:hypothetical protein